ncbi:MAG TPA: hypothetical protein VES60_03200 [Nakamurella sp.]|nr:hypothetical protein [Nakamurella sp.]
MYSHHSVPTTANFSRADVVDPSSGTCRPGIYTVTAQATVGAGVVRGTLAGQQFDAGARAVTVTMVPVP